MSSLSGTNALKPVEKMIRPVNRNNLFFSINGSGAAGCLRIIVCGCINLNFSKKFGITPEVLFSANGSNAEDVKVDLNYISIPLMLRFKPIDLISLEAGPQFSILTKANIEGIGDVKDQLKNNDFGLAFGAGLHLPLGINAGARYVLGFSNINDVDEESIKNRTIQIYVGWTLFGAK